MRATRLARGLAVLVVWAATPSVGDGQIPGPVPAPSSVVDLAVSRGSRYPFPWTGIASCERRVQPGCFLVEEVTPTRVVLRYPRIAVEEGVVKPQGFGYRTPVSRGGSPYELFSIKTGPGREQWVYAVLEEREAERARLRFLSLPAFVTERARLRARIVVEAGWQRLRESYRIDAEEPLTLIGLGRLDALFPSARLGAIEINGVPARSPYAEFLHFNLPSGRHEVTLTVELSARPRELLIQGTLLEPRRMSLFQSLDLRVEPAPGGSPAELEVRTIGLLPETWDGFRSTLVVSPTPAATATGPLAIRYRFPMSDVVALSARPRISVGPNNYPVLIRVVAPDPTPPAPAPHRRPP